MMKTPNTIRKKLSFNQIATRHTKEKKAGQVEFAQKLDAKVRVTNFRVLFASFCARVQGLQHWVSKWVCSVLPITFMIVNKATFHSPHVYTYTLTIHTIPVVSHYLSPAQPFSHPSKTGIVCTAWRQQAQVFEAISVITF